MIVSAQREDLFVTHFFTVLRQTFFHLFNTLGRCYLKTSLNLFIVNIVSLSVLILCLLTEVHNKNPNIMIPEFIRAMALPHIEVQKGTWLVKEGSLCNSIYFIMSGSARLYFIYRSRELTTQFFFPGDAVTSGYSFLNDTPSTLSIDTMEDTDLLVLTKEKWKNRMAKDEIFRHWFYQAMITTEFRHTHHLQDVICRGAQDRYRQVEREQPHWLTCIQPRYIASYLGITRGALSNFKTKKLKEPEL